MANSIIRVPISGDSINVATTEVEVAAGDLVVVTLEASVAGKITVGGSDGGVLVVFQKGPHTVPVPDPPPGD